TASALAHLSVEHAQTGLWARTENRRALAANAVAIGSIVGVVGAAAAWIIVRSLGADVFPIAHAYVALAIAVAAIPARLTALYLNGLLALDARMARVNAGALVASVAQVVPI